jgi:hypothetical protein
MKWLKWFLSGALAVPLGHQLVAAALYAMGWFPRAPYSMQPTPPLGVPQWISLAFWGGVWGVVLGLVVSRIRTPRAFWLTALIFGAIAPTLVAGFVVAPLKGLPAGGNAKLAIAALLVNGAWGLVTAAFYRALDRAWPATSRNSRV